MNEDNMVTPKTWDEFRATGLFFLANQLLHVFGWALVMNIEDGKITSVFPARVKYRGFDDEAQTEQHIKIATYMAENGTVLLEEAKS
ncbi:hypothetical protein AB6735_18585 [Mucilaginibacter sp. RCC_168]|uniref:hypothetical protein n=1 Tax=Mucilaginibacter sp. RCC_168 TaxID=3239221 RepID=UPI003524DD25